MAGDAPSVSGLIVQPIRTLDPQVPEKIDVQLLLRGRDQVLLLHRGCEYRLRVTRQGKLLLTK
jgi:hemin uptake protein HemP